MRKQVCTLDGKPWQCWAAAVHDLQTLLDEGPVTCDVVGKPDIYGRMLGRCLGERPERQRTACQPGLRRGTAQRHDGLCRCRGGCQAKKVGLWQGQFAQPSDFRRASGVGSIVLEFDHRREALTSAFPISRQEQYHASSIAASLREVEDCRPRRDRYRNDRRRPRPAGGCSREPHSRRPKDMVAKGGLSAVSRLGRRWRWRFTFRRAWRLPCAERSLPATRFCMTIQCGRPGTPMPHFDRFAYTDKRCYDMTAKDLGDSVPDRAAVTLSILRD